MKRIAAATFLALLLLAACGDDKSTSSSSSSATFCANAKALGSLSKGTTDAMAMKPADAKKDFEALAAKVIALKSGAPADLVATIDTVAARLTLEATHESMMASDANAGKEEAKMLADHKVADDAAFAKLIASAKSTCKVDIA